MRFELKLDKISDVVIIPFFECYPASCRFCSLKTRPKGKIGFLNTPIESFRQHIEPSHVERVAEWRADNYIILGGEPTLSKYLVDFVIKPIRDKSDGKVIVYTNGFLLGRYMKVKGIDAKVKSFIESTDRLIISMEGSKPYNDAVRGKGFTDLAHYIIEKLEGRTDVAVRMGFHKGNLKYVIEEIEYLRDFGVPVLLFPRTDQPPLSVEEAYRLYSFMGGSDKVWILLPSFTNFVEDLIGRGDAKPCPAGWLKLNILPDGTITPCQWIDYPIATLDNKDEEIERFANRWVERAFNLNPECSMCKFREVCRGGCRVAEDYRWCPLRMNVKPSEGVVNMFGMVREVRSEKVRVEVKKMDGVIVHGCSAGC